MNRVRGKLERQLYHRDAFVRSEESVNRGFAQPRVDDRLREGGFDAVFTPSTNFTGFLKSAVPTFVYSDAVLPLLIGYNPAFDNARPSALREFERAEGLGISKSALAFFSSDWAREGAIKNYGVDPSHVVAVPMGANVPPAPADEGGRLSAICSPKPTNSCQLLFMGVQLGRERAVISRLRRPPGLNKHGIETQLVITGCDPPAEVKELPFVTALGFLDKREAKGVMERINGLLLLQFAFPHLPDPLRCVRARCV